jgi:hypothetical protein
MCNSQLYIFESNSAYDQEELKRKSTNAIRTVIDNH